MTLTLADEADAIIDALDLLPRINHQFRTACDELLKLAALGINGDDDGSMSAPDMLSLRNVAANMWEPLEEEILLGIQASELPPERRAIWKTAFLAALRQAGSPDPL